MSVIEPQIGGRRARLCQLHALAPFTANLLFLALAGAPSARANVYATNIKLYDSAATPPPLASVSPANPALLLPGRSLKMDYLLNDDATVGVVVEIFYGTNVLRTISLPPGNPGTVRGANSILWDGTDDQGSNAALGTYSVRITAAASGYGGWTQFSDDFNAGNYVFEPRGLAVNQNTNSPYYGRVFVGNAFEGTDPGRNPGDKVGLQKLNADGSSAEEGIFSDGGWPWAGNTLSPWKMEVSEDDYLYVADRASNGLVLRFNQTISPASRLMVLRNDNRPGGGSAKLNGPFITGAGTNSQIWMADVNPTNRVGIRRWNVAAGGALATNDWGLTVVQADGGSDLDACPYDVAVDKDGRIYVVQNALDAGLPEPNSKILRFPANPSGATPLTNADWKLSGAGAFPGAFGIAVDSTGTYVAVAQRGVSANNHTGAALTVLATTNGGTVTTLAAGSSYDHVDVAWDNVGNLYGLDNFSSRWRAYSPPGANAATTIALQSVRVGNTVAPPTLSAPAWSGGQFQFTLIGQANASYIIETSTNLQNWVAVLTNSSIEATRPITLAAPDSESCYRALVGP